MNAPVAITRFVPPTTLADVNGHFATLGLPRLSKSQFAMLCAQEPRERLLNAMQQAPRRPNARFFLAKAIAAAMAAATTNLEAAPPARPEKLASIESVPRKLELAVSARTKSARPCPEGQAKADNANPELGLKQPLPEIRKPFTHHAYGNKAALCFEAGTSRRNEPTLFIDATEAIGERRFDWKNKLRLQLMPNELLALTAVLYGALPKIEFKNHGEGKDKGFSVEDQGAKTGGLFFRVFAKGRLIAVPVTADDAYAIAALCLRQLKLATPWLSGSDILVTVRQVTARLRRARAV